MTPLEVVIGWHTDYKTDPEGANERYLAEDVQMLLPRSRALTGRTAVGNKLANVASDYTELEYAGISEYTVMAADGDIVFHRFRWKGTTVKGESVDFFLVNLYRVQDEKIVVWEEHFDTYARYQHDYGYEPSDYFDGYEPESRLVIPSNVNAT